MEITKKDVIWSYAATFMKIAASGLLLPFILKMMPSETVGIWSVFMTITAFTTLLDFGFGPSFSRNVTYIYSGVKSLKTNGFEIVSGSNIDVDYSLLKSTIKAMQWFYSRMAIVLFLLLATIGTYYIYSLVQNYSGNHLEVYIAWILLCIINTYNLYTLYYDSLLMGYGLVKRSKQIIIIGQTVYLIIAAILILNGNGLVAIVSAQALSVIIIRWLSYKSFFSVEIKLQLKASVEQASKEVIKVITPNAIKIGLTSIGGFMVQRSAIIVGSLYLPLTDIASFGVTMQLIAIITGLAGIYTSTYQPKIVQLRVGENSAMIKELFLKGQIIQVLTYIMGGAALLFLGEWALNFIGSQTQLLAKSMLFVAIIISFLENNHSIAGGILLTNNEVPFFKASLIAGGITIILLMVMFNALGIKLWAMVLAPGIAHLYNNWKWPYEVYSQLKITKYDFKNVFIKIADFTKNEKK